MVVQGCTRPLPMPPRSAWAWARAMSKTGEAGKAMAAAMNVWEGDDKGRRGECEDPWIATALRGWRPDTDAHFVELAQSVYGPLCAAIKDGGRA
ncbi:MAG TPA: hypothetical protein VF269_02625, partial [Rhodanobacteraceae bacterium]